MVHHHGTVRKLDQLTARVFDSATRGAGCRLDAHRDGGTLYIDIDLPGVGPAGVDVTVDRQAVTVRAERRVPAAEPSTGTSTRRVTLPAALDADRLEARYDNGVLTMRIPVEAEPPHLAAAA